MLFFKDDEATSKASHNRLLNEEVFKSSEGDTGSEAPLFVYNECARLSLREQRERLPVFQHRSQVLHLLETHRTLIVVGSTGSGKSTQIPQYLLEAGWAARGYRILVTQPRRVAVVSVASRVAEERGSQIGHEVGYVIRFESSYNANSTRLLFMTDGILIQELMRDPLLSKYR